MGKFIGVLGLMACCYALSEFFSSAAQHLEKRRKFPALQNVLLHISILLLFCSAPFGLLVHWHDQRLDKKRDAATFDSKVLSTIDGLYLSGMSFGCTDFEMRAHASRLLEQAHALPDTECLLTHAVSFPEKPNIDGMMFRSHTSSRGDHIPFALLCIIDYAKKKGNQSLIAQCDQLLYESRQQTASYYHPF